MQHSNWNVSARATALHRDALVWDNPFRAADSTDSSAYTSPGSGSVNGSSRGRITLAPDNDASTFFADLMNAGA